MSEIDYIILFATKCVLWNRSYSKSIINNFYDRYDYFFTSANDKMISIIAVITKESES